MHRSFSSLLILGLITVGLHACKAPPRENTADASAKASQSNNISPPPATRESATQISDSHQPQEKVLESPILATLISQDDGARIHIRQAPNTDTEILHYGFKGDDIRLLKSYEENGRVWFFAEFEKSGATGWVRGDFIQEKDRVWETIQTPYGETPVFTELYSKNPQQKIWVYSEPSFDSKALHFGYSTDKVKVREVIAKEDGFWHFVKFRESGADGYVHDQFFLPK